MLMLFGDPHTVPATMQLMYSIQLTMSLIPTPKRDHHQSESLPSDESDDPDEEEESDEVSALRFFLLFFFLCFLCLLLLLSLLFLLLRSFSFSSSFSLLSLFALLLLSVRTPACWRKASAAALFARLAVFFSCRSLRM